LGVGRLGGVYPAGRGAEYAGDRAGPSARLGRGAVTPRPPMWCSASHRSARAGWSRQSRGWTALSVPFGLRCSRPRGYRHTTLAEQSSLRAAVSTRRWPLSGLPNGWPGCSSRRTRWQGGPGRSRCMLSCGSGRPGWWNRPWSGWMNSSKRPLRCAASWGAATRSGSPTGRGRCARARRQRSLPVGNHRTGLVQAFLLEAITRDALGDAQAAARALERTLEIAEPDGVLFPFLLHPASGLLDRHRRTRKAIPCIMPGRQTA
jgi:hypothetical protein